MHAGFEMQRQLVARNNMQGVLSLDAFSSGCCTKAPTTLTAFLAGCCTNASRWLCILDTGTTCCPSMQHQISAPPAI